MVYDPATSGPGTLDSLDANIATGVGTQVNAHAVQTDGKIIIGGTFTSVLGVSRNHIARLNADGTLDMGFDPNAAPSNAAVQSVAILPDGKILIGGSFLTLQPNGAPSATSKARLARLNADGTIDASFDPRPNATVNAIAFQPDGLILVGGNFTSFNPNGAGSVGRNRITRLNANGTVDTPFNAGANNQVLTVALQPDGKVLIGGTFTTVTNGATSTRNRIARLNADSTVDATFDPNASSQVDSIVMQPDTKILLGGLFTTLQPNSAPSATTRNRIARLNSDGTIDSGFDPNSSGEVSSIAMQADGKILLGGSFSTIGGTARAGVGRINSAGTLDTGFVNPGVNGPVFGVTLQPDGMVLIGGNFTTLQPTCAPSPITRQFFARLFNDSATQSLSAPDTSQVLWSRGGSAPEISVVTFELSTDGGSNWSPLGNGTRVGSTSNWQLTGLSLPASGQLRARGRTANAFHSGSSCLTEQVAAYTAPPPNTAPSITSAVGLSRQQGTAASISTVATVNDTQTAPGSLTVTAPTVPSGLTISNITNNNGTINADIAASCAATLGNNTIVLQVSDGALTTNANLVINVTNNSAPALSYNNPAAIAYGGSTAFNPATASDNGTIANFAVQSLGTYAGLISVNSTTGAVSISNAAPVGSHTITIRATDNCGSFTDASFMLTVNRRAVTVTADAKVKVKGAADPALTYVATGLIGIDTLSGTLARNGGEAPGIYSITQGTVTDANNPNYTITFVSANLIITGPVASSDAVTRVSGSASSLFPLATLLANDSRIDSNGAVQTNNLSITGVTAGVGNSVSISGAFVSYTPDNAVATAPLTFTYTVTDSVSGATDVGLVTVVTVPLTIVQAGTATYNAGTDTTSITVSFTTLPNTSVNMEYSTDLNGWVAHAGNPVTSSPTGSLVVTFTAPGNQTTIWNRGMFFRASTP